jgi:hypothetical protein
MHTAQHDVGALARQRQLELDEHLDPVETGLDEIGGEDVQAPIPGPRLSRRRRSRQLMPVLLEQRRHQAAVKNLRAELRDRAAVQRHDETPAEGRRNLPAGGGSSCGADSLVGPQC